MRTLILISIFFLISCDNKDKSTNVQKTDCSLVDKTEDAFSTLRNYYDFTLKNVNETSHDKEGTGWTNQISDEFRFVFKDNDGTARSREGNLLVYKNNSLFKKYLNVQFTGSIETKVDKIKCAYEQSSKYNLSYKQGNDYIINIFGNTDNFYADYYSPGSVKYQGHFTQFNIGNR